MSGTSDARSSGLPVGSQFVTTHWSVVLRAARGEDAQAEEALARLCRVYWYPLYSFIRRQGHRPPDAEDLTQEFFARLLERRFLAAIQPERGKFRSFLLMALKRFLAKEWERAHALKRGGAAHVLAIDVVGAETRFEAEATHDLPPDLAFDRQWASTLLEQAMARLREEYADSGRGGIFTRLKGALSREKGADSYATVGTTLGMSEAAVKMAVQRLRRRYREILREEIAQTLADSEGVEEELRHLFAAFSSSA